MGESKVVSRFLTVWGVQGPTLIINSSRDEFIINVVSVRVSVTQHLVIGKKLKLNENICRSSKLNIVRYIERN